MGLEKAPVSPLKQKDETQNIFQEIAALLARRINFGRSFKRECHTMC